jgi:hypothetical protein
MWIFNNMGPIVLGKQLLLDAYKREVSIHNLVITIFSLKLSLHLYTLKQFTNLGIGDILTGTPPAAFILLFFSFVDR